MGGIITENKIGSLSKSQLQAYAFDFCKELGSSMASWRIPNQDEVHLIIGSAVQDKVKGTSLEDLPSGFMFSPFDKKKSPVFIEKEIHINLNTKGLTGSSDKIDEFQAYISGNEDPSKTTANNNEDGSAISSNEQSNAQFTKLVTEGINRIKSGELQKVVPSRSKTIELPEGLQLNRLFFELCEAYPNAFVSTVYSPECGIWLGATPELLLELDKNEFKTVALAGTQPYDPAMPMSEVAWTQKEIEEQALVSRYIINCFKKIRLREFEEYGPKTARAGNLIHLKTEYVVDMEATNFPDLGSVMLELLHPTSAICGMPLEASQEFIRNFETYDREYFSGYLGPVKIGHKTSLFVNLRCMKVRENHATLYAGAGITEDSNPEKEYQETEMKMNTLLNLINS
ncbi:isochorismate synthase [Fulvivirga sp. M361]|uniref:chorismate-binding protein n=1 Tax=Fulvivirga sp. M361 TaxID=2594266 RepID=UPI00117BCCDE|nr:chorismate-binding protein [Fulvivirga sp. M361]TRX49485.1 isochorismate synthase [Fulvivirga sp. M361]